MVRPPLSVQGTQWRTRLSRWLLPIGLLATTTGCPGFGDKTLAELEGIEGEITWEADIKPIFAARCWQCHEGNGPGPLTYLTYEQAFAGLVPLNDRIVIKRDMPLSISMPDSERAVFELWVNQGAPQGTVVAAGSDAAVEAPEAPDMAVDAAPLTYEDRIGAILTAKCAVPGCHVGDPSASELDLSTYEGFLLGGATGVIHGDGDPSVAVLMKRLRGDGVAVMPQFSDGLPASEIEAFSAWIAAGYPKSAGGN